MFADERPARWAVILRLLLVVVAAGALVGVGRVTAPDEHPPRFVAGVPVGFARSEDGARAAAMTYAAARARATLLAPARRRSVLAAIGTARFAALAEREDRSRDLAPLSGQEEGRYLVTALASSVEAFDEERVRVTVWLFQTFAADTAVGSFSTQTVDLAWRDDDWRLDGQRDALVQAVPEIAQTPRFSDTRRVLDSATAPRFGRP